MEKDNKHYPKSISATNWKHFKNNLNDNAKAVLDYAKSIESKFETEEIWDEIRKCWIIRKIKLKSNG